MASVALSLLAVVAVVGMAGCGGSSSSDAPGGSASNEVTRSLTSGTGQWQHDTATGGTTCIEEWEFEGDGDYEVQSTVSSVSTGIGIGSFNFDTVVLSGERHALVFTASDIEATTTCGSSPYEESEPAASASLTLYLEFSTSDQFDVYTAATDGTNLGAFTRQ